MIIRRINSNFCSKKKLDKSGFMCRKIKGQKHIATAQTTSGPSIGRAMQWNQRNSGTLTISLMDYVTIANRYWCQNECMVVIFDGSRWLTPVAATNAIPWILFDMHMSWFNVTIFAQEMIGQSDSEFFRWFDAEFLGQQINGVLLRICCHDVRVVAWK